MGEVRETIYIAISAIIASIILGLISTMMYIKSNIAEVRNNEIAGKSNVTQFRMYNKYNSKELCGDEVIECIRLYYDKGIDIIVNTRTNIKSGDTIDSSDIIIDGDGRVWDKRIFNTENAVRYPDLIRVGTTIPSTESNILQNWFPTEKKYAAYLIYNSAKPSDVLNKLYATGGSYTDEAGNIVNWSGYLNRRLTEADKDKIETMNTVYEDYRKSTYVSFSEVTAIIFFDISSL